MAVEDPSTSMAEELDAVDDRRWICVAAAARQRIQVLPPLSLSHMSSQFLPQVVATAAGWWWWEAERWRAALVVVAWWWQWLLLLLLWWWWCWRAALVVAAAVTSSRWGLHCLVGGPVIFFVLKKFLCRGPDGALGTSLPRVGPVTLSTNLFASPTVPSALCRELLLCRGCAERIPACAESNSLSAKPWIPVVNCCESTLRMQETKASFICASNASKEFPNARQHGSEDIQYIVRSDRKILHWSQITIHLNLLLFFCIYTKCVYLKDQNEYYT
jgi:hypothetical protein